MKQAKKDRKDNVKLALNGLSSETAVIILAAGKGTRMKSQKAKVLHEILGRPMVLYVLKTANQISPEHIIVVVGHQAERVREVVKREYSSASFAYQKEQLGTGHAVLVAMPYISEEVKQVLILYGDVPLISKKTLKSLLKTHKDCSQIITVLAVKTRKPEGYGRIVMGQNGQLAEIVEEADATEEIKKIDVVNTGICCVQKDYLEKALKKIESNNTQREYYLTDIIGIGRENGVRMGMVLAESFAEVMGVNRTDELDIVENYLKIG